MYRRLDKGDWIKWQRDCDQFIKDLRKEIKKTNQSNQSNQDEWWFMSDDNKKICKAPTPLTDKEFADTQRNEPFWR